MPNPDVLDPAIVERLRQLTPPGEPDVAQEVLKLFVDEVPRRMARMKAACEDGNALELQRAAHSLKGSSGNIGAHRMYDICRQLDERGKAGDFNGARHLLELLDAAYGEVEVEISRFLHTS